MLCDRAAGTCDGTLYLTDSEVFSTLVSEPGSDDFEAIRRQHVPDGGTGTSAPRHGIPVRMVDFLTALGSEPIDLLKIDIEGSEHAILDDPRFGALPVQLSSWSGTTRRNTPTDSDTASTPRVPRLSCERPRRDGGRAA